MASCARREIVQLEKISIYHCWNRCVRQAFLLGEDANTGKNYEYRREWIRNLQELMASQFAIEVGFHSEMANHLHTVLRTRPDIVRMWSDEEVVRRWLTLTLLPKSKTGELRAPKQADIDKTLADAEKCQDLRRRLVNPSSYMSILDEAIARRCNREDECQGHFWEGRYKCREILDEAALLTCGMYVDLNPIRAGDALTPETSVFTSAYDRIVTWLQVQTQEQQLEPPPQTERESEYKTQGNESVATSHARTDKTRDGWLCELTLDPKMDMDDPRLVSSATKRRATDKGMLSMTLEDYLRLLDATGRIVRSDKAGAIPAELAPILERIGIRPTAWGEAITNFNKLFGRFIGAAQRVAERVAATGRQSCRGMKNCAAVFT